MKDTKIQTKKQYYQKEKEVSEYSCIQKDETIINVGSKLTWL